MHQNIKSIHNKKITAILFGLLLCFFLSSASKEALAASKVSIGVSNYEELTSEIKAAGNGIVYYSTDEKNWYEVEGPYNSTNDTYTMDISWISDKADTTIYYKGNSVKSVVEAVYPMTNNEFSVVYNKVDGDFTFDGVDDLDYVEWRKSSDYQWNMVELDENSISYQRFLQKAELLRNQGVKLVFRTPSQNGKNANDMGMRSSKEVTVTLSKRGNAPNVTVNVSRLTINTTSSMEYYDSSRNMWIETERNMALEDLLPSVLYKNGGKSVSVKIRTAETASAPHSKTRVLTIPGQRPAPTIGDNSSDVSYYYMNQNVIIQFHKASSTSEYEYTIVKPGGSFNYTTSSWIKVNSSKQITLNKSKAPEGSVIYIRQKGTDANASKNLSLQLASEIRSFTVKLPTR